MTKMLCQLLTASATANVYLRTLKLHDRTVHTRLRICMPCMVMRGEGAYFYHTHGHKSLT